MQVDKQHVEPAILISENGFFELIGKSDVPDAVKFRHWLNNILSDLLLGINIESINGGQYKEVKSNGNNCDTKNGGMPEMW